MSRCLTPRRCASAPIRWREGGIEELLRTSYEGSEAPLNGAQFRERDAHLRESLNLRVESVARLVETRCGALYTLSGGTAMLHRLVSVYNGDRLLPGRADAAAQESLVEGYRELKENNDEDHVVLFADATHPLHKPAMCAVVSNAAGSILPRAARGSWLLNINGAIDIGTLAAHTRFDDAVDAASTSALSEQMQRATTAKIDTSQSSP